jgi:hypothetical protein
MNEIEEKMQPLKARLRYLENEGLNAGATCRLLAVLTQNLTLMEIRQSQVINDPNAVPKASGDGPGSPS